MFPTAASLALNFRGQNLALSSLSTFLHTQVKDVTPPSLARLPQVSFLLLPLYQLQLQRLDPHKKRIYLISMGAMVMGATDSQRQLLSTTTMNRLLLGICWITKDLWEQVTRQ